MLKLSAVFWAVCTMRLGTACHEEGLGISTVWIGACFLSRLRSMSFFEVRGVAFWVFEEGLVEDVAGAGDNLGASSWFALAAATLMDGVGNWFFFFMASISVL